MKKLLLPLAALAVIVTGYLAMDHDYRTTPRLSGAAHALKHFAAQRAYPQKILPGTGYTEAYDLARTTLAEDPGKSTSVDPWQALGPHNIGGRTLAVALNPENPATVYAGSASGGLWRSTTGGVGAAAWDYVDTGHPVLGVSCIAFAPGDSSVMYIGTGEVYSYDDTQGGISVRYTRGSHGIGVLKSTDGGATWFKSLDWSYEQQRGIWQVKVNPLNPSTVWAATTEGTYKSLDAGQSWTRVHDVIMANDLVIDPGDTSRVFVGCGNFSSPGQGIYRTTDGGQSWQKMEQAGIIPDGWAGKTQLAVTPAAPGTVFVSLSNGDVGSYYTRLLRSVDGGDTWTSRSTQDYARWQGWFAHDVAVSPTDPNHVMAVGIDIWKSTTGGTNLFRVSDWTQWYFGQTIPGEPEGPPNYSHADHHDVVFHPTDPDVIYFANDGGIFRSLDGGNTFEGCNGGYQTQQFYAGFSSSQLDPDVAMGGLQDNSTAIYLGSNAWYRAIGGDGSWTAIDPILPGSLFGSAQFLQMFRSYDNGEDWTQITPPTAVSGSPGFIAPFGLARLGGIGPQLLYAAGTKVARSVDNGTSWSGTNGGAVLDGNPALALEVFRANPDVVYVTTAPVIGRARVFVTENGGTNFLDITDNLPDRYLVGLAIDPTDHHRAYVTASGFGTSHVFRIGDGGAIWQDIGAGLPDVPTSAVVVDPLNPQVIYVGNDLGVFVSGDRGESWSGFSLGLPGAVMAMDLTISPVDRMLRVSTYGNGVFERPLVEVPTAIDGSVPTAAVALAQNHPNPFNPATVISFDLGAAGQVTLAIYDAAGRHVRTLMQETRSAGRHEVRWDGTDAVGRRVASGTYVYRLQAGGEERSRTMTLVK